MAARKLAAEVEHTAAARKQAAAVERIAAARKLAAAVEHTAAARKQAAAVEHIAAARKQAAAVEHIAAAVLAATLPALAQLRGQPWWVPERPAIQRRGLAPAVRSLKGLLAQARLPRQPPPSPQRLP